MCIHTDIKIHTIFLKMRYLKNKKYLFLAAMLHHRVLNDTDFCSIRRFPFYGMGEIRLGAFTQNRTHPFIIVHLGTFISLHILTYITKSESISITQKIPQGG